MTQTHKQISEHRRPVIYHGGNLAGAAQLFPDAPRPWIDLSTGINPISYPVGEIAPAAWARLPEPDSVAALEQAAARAYGARPSTTLVAAPGTQALIQILPRLVPNARVGILDFTYAEYARVWRDSGADVETLDSLDALERVDVAIVVNPNNPDGRLIPADRLVSLAQALNGRGGMLVVDEAFADLLGHSASLVPVLPEKNAIVLRSFGKTYGLAGVRLGFAVTGQSIAERIRSILGPWAVSGPAIDIGMRALADPAWLANVGATLDEAAAALDARLSARGFGIVGGTSLFRLAEHPEATRWFGHLGRLGILVRHFPARPDWLRFGIPVGDEANERLDLALNAWE